MKIYFYLGIKRLFLKPVMTLDKDMNVAIKNGGAEKDIRTASTNRL